MPHIDQLTTEDTEEYILDSLDDKSLNAIFQVQTVKVNQQPDRLMSEFEIGDNLCLMYRRERFDSFQFNHDRVFDEEVELVSGF